MRRHCACSLKTANAADTQVPKVAISSPASGATIAGTRTVSGSASDNVAVSKVELRVDGKAYQLASGTTSWTFSLNTSAYANGSHTLTCRATDSSGNQAWASRPVTFSNGTDTQVATVAIASPAVGGDDRRHDDGFRYGLGQRCGLEGGAAGGRQRLPAGERDDLVDVLAEHERLCERQSHASSAGDRFVRQPGVGEQDGDDSRAAPGNGSKIYWGAFMEGKTRTATTTEAHGGTALGRRTPVIGSSRMPARRCRSCTGERRHRG